MAVDTRTVTGRRCPRYQALDDILEDARRLAAGDVEMLGNWSLGQVFRHLAVAIHGSIDGFPFRLPAVTVFVVRLVLKHRYLTRGIRPGHGTSRRWNPVKPAATSTEDGLAELCVAVGRLKREEARAAHPAFGRLTPDEWVRFHLRHAELHMSFAVPRG